VSARQPPSPAERPSGPTRIPPDPLGRWRLVGVVATAVIVLSVPAYVARRALSGERAPDQTGALYVGSESCAPCHKAAYENWLGSHHKAAMQAARPDTVLGDFSGATFQHRGKTWRFFRRGDQFLVEAEGPDGQLQEYEIRYTFGVDPLQQYLVPFAGGRLQCLSVAWDTRKKAWFFLYPGQDVPPADWLHWTRPGQNWNTMCADCHSTGVRKRYDPERDIFQTTWSEIMVGCEACHGPGSRHKAWADQPAMARPQVDNYDLTTKTSALGNRDLVNLCMPCHSRRAQFADQQAPGGEPLDRYLPVLLQEGVFHPDGQILEEDYEYHSFIQSKMFANGVKCSDCHDVHRAKRLKDGNDLCTRCHRSDTYDTEAHHFHKKTVDGKPSAGALCTSCHMPGQYYMVVHYRLDHSIRVPRPDLTETIGTPNACNAAGCHADKSVRWAVEKHDVWYGRARKPHYGTVIAAGRTGAPATWRGLVDLAQDQLRPAIARATALDLLGSAKGADVSGAFERALGDPDPLMRWTAASRLRLDDAARLVKLLGPLLKDPVTAVRMEAAVRLAEAPVASLSDAQRESQARALDEYIAAQRYMADMPSGPYNLGNAYATQGKDDEAERQYRRALAIDDRFYPARVNLAMLLARAGRQEEAEAQLRSARAEQPASGSIAFNLGLILAERGKTAEAEEALAAALEADPSLAAAAYNLGVIVGERQPAKGAELCRRAAELEPQNPKYAFSYAFFLARAGDRARAAAALEALLTDQPAYVDAYVLLSEVYEGLGRRADAVALLQRASQVSSLPADARAALAARARALAAGGGRPPQ